MELNFLKYANSASKELNEDDIKQYAPKVVRGTDKILSWLTK
jgi:hypothetical protein